MADLIQISEGATGPSLTDTITIDGRAVDLTGATVTFRMRAEQDGVLKVDTGADIDDGPGGKVHYDWANTDTDDPGLYYFWWHVELSGGQEFDAPEQPLVVDAHSPGFGTILGAVAKRSRAYLPTTFDGLSSYERFGGDRAIQETVELVKARVMGAGAPVVGAESGLSALLLGYLAKLVALELIPAGKDYWLNQHQVISTEGTEESVSYPDRIRGLESVQEDLIRAIAMDQPIITPEISTPQLQSGPRIDEAEIHRVTRDPRVFPEEDSFPHRHSELV